MLTVRMQHQGTVVAQLPEQVDYDNAILVGAQCEDLVRQGCVILVLDACRLEYLDSSGISMIIKVWRILVDHAGTLRVANLNAHYRQVWCLLGLDTLFPVSPTVQAALGPGWNGSAAGMTALPPRSGW